MNYTVFTCALNGDEKTLKVFSDKQNITIIIDDLAEREFQLFEIDNADLLNLYEILKSHLQK